MKKKLKVWQVILIVVACVIVLSLCAIAFLMYKASIMFSPQIEATKTVERINDRLYILEYNGDYGFDEFLENGGASDSDQLASYIAKFLSHGFYTPKINMEENTYGCSTLCVKNEEGQVLTGRNYDWEQCTGIIIHTKPENGYESVSTACVNFLGFGDDFEPDDGFLNKMLSIAAIYIPLDGMNEKGLMIADLIAGDDVETHQKTDKPDITTTTAIRLILDKAANVDEAIALLSNYDMNSDIGAAHHYFISDAQGKSVVVEYIDGEMVVTDTDVLTNHYLSDCEKKGTGSEQSHDRFDKLKNILSENNSILSQEDVRDALKSVCQGSYNDEYEVTQWSVVYMHDTLEMRFYWEENYEKEYILKIGADSDWINGK